MTGLRFTGQRAEGIGLYDYGARWYDPVLGRFVQADSVVPSMGDSRARDRYVYVKKNPVKFIDPSGHMLDPGGGGSSMWEVIHFNVNKTCFRIGSNQWIQFV